MGKPSLLGFVRINDAWACPADRMRATRVREAAQHSQIRRLSAGSEVTSVERHWQCSIGNRLGSEKVEFDTCQRRDLAGFKRTWDERSPVKQSPKNEGRLHNEEGDHFNTFQNQSKTVDLSSSFLLVYLEESETALHECVKDREAQSGEMGKLTMPIFPL